MGRLFFGVPLRVVAAFPIFCYKIHNSILYWLFKFPLWGTEGAVYSLLQLTQNTVIQFKPLKQFCHFIHIHFPINKFMGCKLPLHAVFHSPRFQSWEKIINDNMYLYCNGFNRFFYLSASATPTHITYSSPTGFNINSHRCNLWKTNNHLKPPTLQGVESTHLNYPQNGKSSLLSTNSFIC